MDDREIIQWDKRLTDQARRGWDNYKHLHIDLSIARIDQSYLIAGEYLYIEDSSSTDAKAKLKMNRSNNDALDLEKGVEIETVFIEIFVTNDALENEWLDLVFGINFKYKKKIDGGLTYVDRGDIAVHDWTDVFLIEDGTWRDLDLSAIIPVGTVLVKFHLTGRDTVGNKYLQFRQNGNVNFINIENRITQAANIYMATTLLVVPDDNRIIEYRIQVAVWTTLNLSVTGWFLAT